MKGSELISKYLNDVLHKKIARLDAVSPLADPLRKLLECSPVCTKIVDLNSRLQYMSEAGRKQLKIDDVQSLYGSIFPSNIYSSTWKTTVADHLNRAMQGNESSLECPVIDAEGNEVWYESTFVPARDEKGEIQYVIVTSVDITERRIAAEALRASENRSRNLLEGSPVCTKIIDLESRLQYMSNAGQQQLNICNVESFYGSEFPPDLYPSSWRPQVKQCLARAMQGDSCSIECPVLSTSGEEVWYDTTFVPARDDKGLIQHVIVTSVNITERRKAEGEARKLRDELAHVSRVSTMGEMATGIAHELNQPLAAIASYNYAAKMLAERNPAYSDEFREILDRLEDQAIRAGEIVRHLRSFVTKTESIRARTCLNRLVQKVAEFVEPDIQRAGVNLNLDFDSSSPSVFVDPIQIQQVMVNLLRNALDAMEETQEGARDLSISTRANLNGFTEVLVSDTGKGLSVEEQGLIFESFFSTKQKGMGMGLPISRSIIEAHGGKLWVRGNIEEGATFGFSLPHENNIPQDLIPTVFVIDDESAMRDSLVLLVQSTGRLAKGFSSASEFLDYFADYEISQPVCLIADVQMQNVNGIELLERLEAMNKAIPTIMITGHGTAAIKKRVKELGAVDCIEKPFRPAQIREFVTGCLGPIAKSIQPTQ